MEYSNLKKYFWNFYSPSLLPYHRFLSIVVKTQYNLKFVSAFCYRARLSIQKII